MLPSLLALTLGGLALTATPARAQWAPYNSTNTFPGYPQTWNRTPSPYGPSGSALSAQAFGGAPLTGGVTFTFRWAGAQGQTVTPLTVLLNGNVNLGGMNPTSPSLSDGLGDPTVPYWSPPTPVPVSYTSSGKHLVQMSAPSGAGPGYLLSLTAVTLNASGTQGGAGIGCSATFDSRAVSISCPGLEPSHYNLTGPVAPGSPPATHMRGSNGSMQADTVVNYNGTAGEWVGGPNSFNVSASGFTSPSCVWSLSGAGSPSTTTQMYLGTPGGVGGIPVQLFFSSASFPQSSAVNVNVTDNDGATGTGTYNVTWHLPLENVTLLSEKKNVPILYGGLQDIALNSSVPATITIPGQAGEIDWGAVAQGAGLPVAVIGASAGAFLLAPEVTIPAGIAVVATQAVCAGASYKLSLSTPTNPGTIPIQGNADYNEYTADLNMQVLINNDPADYGTNMVRFLPTTEAAQAQAGLLSAAQFEQDPFFMGCTAQWEGGWYFDNKTLQGDGYGVSGYTGPVPCDTSVATVTFKYFRWTCTYSPPSNP